MKAFGRIDLRGRNVRLTKKEKGTLFKLLVAVAVAGPILFPKHTEQILSVTGGLAAVAGINVTGEETGEE